MFQSFVADAVSGQWRLAQNGGRPGGSAIDQRTTRHAGYRFSQRKRKRIEGCFGWLKTIALPRKLRHRGLAKVDWIFALGSAAYNLVGYAIWQFSRHKLRE